MISYCFTKHLISAPSFFANIKFPFMLAASESASFDTGSNPQNWRTISNHRQFFQLFRFSTTESHSFSIVFRFHRWISPILIEWEVTWLRPGVAKNRGPNSLIKFCNCILSFSDNEVSFHFIALLLNGFHWFLYIFKSYWFIWKVHFSTGKFQEIYFENAWAPHIVHYNKCPGNSRWTYLHSNLQSISYLTFLAFRGQQIDIPFCGFLNLKYLFTISLEMNLIWTQVSTTDWFYDNII